MLRTITLALLLLWQAATSKTSPSIAPLSRSEMKITQLDWALLKAQIKSSFAEDRTQISLEGFDYDAIKDRIVATAMVGRSRVETTPADKMKASLEHDAIRYCVDVFFQIEELTSRTWSVEEEFKHCYVQFVTWGPTLDLRVFAVFEDGGIRWK